MAAGDFHPPGPLPPVVSCPVSPVDSPPPFGSYSSEQLRVKGAGPLHFWGVSAS